MKTIAVGAEAVIRADEQKQTVVKERVPKSYRVKELDRKLRLHRMKREAKITGTLLGLGVAVPKLCRADEEKMSIEVELVKGRKLKDVLDERNYRGMCADVGKSIGIMHSNNIVHGDLTTSNMIRGSVEGRVYLIDFGLSLFSRREEDKAVDLHLFRQSLSSSHNRIAAKCFSAAMDTYKRANTDWEKVRKRLEIIEMRGRNRARGKQLTQQLQPG